MSKREVWVIERRGEPKRSLLGDNVAAYSRIQVDNGEYELRDGDDIVRYVPAPKKKPKRKVSP